MDEKVLQELQTELKGFIARKDDELKTIGTVQTETKSAIEQLVKRIDAIEVKAAMMKKGPRGRGSVSFELSAKSSAEIIERKNISSAGIGFPTYGVMPAERDGGIVWQPRPKLRMLDVIPSRPTSLGEIYWVTETARPTKASPVTEYTGLKPLVEPTFGTDHEKVETIAVLMKASNQVLADWTELEGFLRSEGAARVQQELDLQLLSGSGSSPNLNGLVTQGAAWDLTLLSASDGYEYTDMLAGSRQQVAEADELEESPFHVLHPGDAWAIRRLKDSTGRYIFADPGGSAGPLTIFGAPVVETTQITKGTFLTGSGSPMAAEYRNRQNLTVEISTEDGDNFKYNLVTIRFELRGALIVKRPNAFVHGSLTKSPA
jgi:HK97 family phage major capsid protein